MSSQFVSITSQPQEESPKQGALLKRLGVGLLATAAGVGLYAEGTTVIENLYHEHKETRQLNGDFGPAATLEAQRQKAAREAVAKGMPLQVYLEGKSGPTTLALYKPTTSSLFSKESTTVPVRMNVFETPSSGRTAELQSGKPVFFYATGSDQTVQGNCNGTYFGIECKGKIPYGSLTRAVAAQQPPAAETGGRTH